MLNYIIISTFTWSILLLFYVFLLRQEKHFTYNRVYLLTSIVLGLIIPTIPQFSFLNDNSVTNFFVKLPELTITNNHQKSTTSTEFFYSYILLSIYFIGLAIALFKLMKSLVYLRLYYDKGEIIKSNEKKIIKIKEHVVAFSFFNYIFINKDIYESNQRDEVLMHESIHVQQGHSYDIMFLEILKSIFWFNPIVYIYKAFISETHEFIADNYVIKKIPKKSYGELLINQLQSGVQYGIANYFINSLIKNRIKMMYKTKTNRKWKYLLAIPVLVFVLLFANACQNDDKENVQVQDKEQIYKIVEEMPRFPGCEAETNLDDKQTCATQKMYNYLYSHMKYPSKAQDNKIEGKVVARFVVDSQGNMKDMKILRDIGGGCGDEVMKVLQSMNKLSEKWIPGKQNGKNVSVYYTLPVVFKLTD